MAFPDYTEVEQEDGSKACVCVECKATRYPGDWPQCPHTPGHFGEEPMEPYFDEHIIETGAEITTRSQRGKLMDKNNLEFRPNRFRTKNPVFFDMGRSGR